MRWSSDVEAESVVGLQIVDIAAAVAGGVAVDAEGSSSVAAVDVAVDEYRDSHSWRHRPLKATREILR